MDANGKPIVQTTSKLPYLQSLSKFLPEQSRDCQSTSRFVSIETQNHSKCPQIFTAQEYVVCRFEFLSISIREFDRMMRLLLLVERYEQNCKHRTSRVLIGRLFEGFCLVFHQLSHVLCEITMRVTSPKQFVFAINLSHLAPSTSIFIGFQQTYCDF